MQSKRHSFLEAWTNTLLGFGLSVLTQVLIFPLYGIQVTLFENLQLTLAFAFRSTLRSYCVRRWFNRRG